MDPSDSEDESADFIVYLDVQQFKLEDLSVKLLEDGTVSVEGKHTERPDKHGFIARAFKRRYVIPRTFDLKNIKCYLYSDGVLQIIAPRIDKMEKQEIQDIPIEMTGSPFKSTENEDTKNERVV